MATTQTLSGSSSQRTLNESDVLFRYGEMQAESNPFSVGETPLRVTLWLPEDFTTDEVIFYRVLEGDATCRKVTGCCVKEVGGVQEIARIRYKICDCEPKLTNDNRMITIDQSGKYQAVLQANGGGQAASLGTVLVMTEREKCAVVNDEMRGCCG